MPGGELVAELAAGGRSGEIDDEREPEPRDDRDPRHHTPPHRAPARKVHDVIRHFHHPISCNASRAAV